MEKYKSVYEWWKAIQTEKINSCCIGKSNAIMYYIIDENKMYRLHGINKRENNYYWMDKKLK